jgi:two-component system response regulator (stage 0 sporulation protein A)
MIRVVLADDNTQLCHTLREHIDAQPDMQVVGIAGDGEQALEALDRWRPDVLLLDITMPRLDGLAVLERLNTRGVVEKPCVVVLTALGHDDVAQRLTELGARYFIVKPFDLDLLTERMRQFVAPTQDHVIPAARQSRSRSSAFVHENRITGLLHEMGVPSHFKGYNYLREAVAWALRQPAVLSGSLTTELYPSVAGKYNTTANGVEAAIRHGIRAAWRNNRPFLAEITGTAGVPRKTPPSNSVVISKLVDAVEAMEASDTPPCNL